MQQPQEQPIYTTKAHVFQIDPSTKKNWIPASSSSINVSYYYDSTRNAYRIISVEGSKAVINSTITPNMSFTKTSQKFGQWSDPRANTVYGLGFGAEGDLNKFVEKFQEVKELTRQTAQKNVSQTNGVDSSGSSSPVTSRDGTPVKNIEQPPQNLPANQDASSQLKYENDRLKIALAQSSSNAKKWEVELQTLKNNNARLTTALQESTTNVEEWKKQLASYKEENARIKKKAQEMEKGQGSNDQVVALQQQIAEVNKKMQSAEAESAAKQKELDQLQEKIESLSQVESQNAELGDRIQDLEGENESLQQRIGDLELEVTKVKNQQQKERDDLKKYHQQIANKLSSLYEVHDQMGSVLQQTP